MDRNTVHVRIIHEPDDLVREQLRVVLAVQVRLGGLGRVQLQTLANTLAQDVARRVGLHDLRHSLLDQRLHAGEPVAVGAPEVVREVHANHDTSGRRVQTHRVRDVVEELGASVPFNIVGVEVTPTELDVQPELVARRSIEDVLALYEL